MMYVWMDICKTICVLKVKSLFILLYFNNIQLYYYGSWVNEWISMIKKSRVRDR